MAKKNKGVLGAMGNLVRWTIWGLAGVLAVAVYLNFAKTPQPEGGDEIAVLPPADIAVGGDTEEATEGNEAVTEAEVTESAEAAEEVTETATEDATEPLETVGDVMSDAGDRAADALSEIRIPGSDATYSLLNAFRRDDGSLEIATQRKDATGSFFELRRITCAPLAVATIASGTSTEALSARDDAAELERIPLGSAESLVAATMCGAFR